MTLFIMCIVFVASLLGETQYQPLIFLFSGLLFMLGNFTYAYYINTANKRTHKPVTPRLI